MSQTNDWWQQGATVAEPSSEKSDWWMQGSSPTEPPARGVKGWARDIAATAVKGAIAVPEAVVGLADIPTGGAVGKFLENEGGAVGFRPKQAKEAVNDWHSDATKEAQRKFQAADGLVDKATTAIQNPSLIASAVGESIPSMLAGGVAARGLMAATRLGQMGAQGAALAGAAGEGITMAGSAAEQIRQETPDGLLNPTQAGLAAATGVVGGAVGALGGRVAQKLGIGDAETMLAQGQKGMQQEFADTAAKAVSNPLVQQQAAKSIPRQVIEGAISEGFLEELPQSVAEQVFQNLALGKDWLTDVDSAVVMGVLSGGAMGGAAAGYHGVRAPGAGPAQVGDGATASQDGQQAPGVEQTSTPGLDRVREAFSAQLQSLQQQEQGEPVVAQSTPPDGAAILQQQRAQELAQRQADIEASRAVASPDDEIYQSTGAAEVRPSVRMGIDPNAGPLSAGAAIAVDSGVADQVQQASALAQAAEQAKKGGVQSASVNQKDARPALAQQGLDLETGEIAQPNHMAAWSDAQLSDSFRGAQSREVRMQLAQELSRRRTERSQQALQDELAAEQSAPDPSAPGLDAGFASVREYAGMDAADLQVPAVDTKSGRKAAQAIDGNALAAIDNVAQQG